MDQNLFSNDVYALGIIALDLINYPYKNERGHITYDENGKVSLIPLN